MMKVRCVTCGEEFDGDAMSKHLEVCQKADYFRRLKAKEKARKAKKRLENLARKRMLQNTDKNNTKKRKKKVIRIVQKKVSDYV